MSNINTQDKLMMDSLLQTLSLYKEHVNSLIKESRISNEKIELLIEDINLLQEEIMILNRTNILQETNNRQGHIEVATIIIVVILLMMFVSGVLLKVLSGIGLMIPLPYGGNIGLVLQECVLNFGYFSNELNDLMKWTVCN